MKTWSLPQRILHWGAALVVLACIGAVWGHEAFPKGSAGRQVLMQLHFVLGLLVGLHILPRIDLRLRSPGPALDGHPVWARYAARGLQVFFYGALLVLPVTGFLAAAGGRDLSILGATIPALGLSRDTVHLAKEIHEGLAMLLIAGIALHVAAAIRHHLNKDNVLEAMLPCLGRKPN